MCVGFLYTLVVRRPFESLITDVSRKGMLLSYVLSFSVSMVIILYSNIQIQGTRVFEKEDHEVIPI